MGAGDLFGNERKVTPTDGGRNALSEFFRNREEARPLDRVVTPDQNMPSGTIVRPVMQLDAISRTLVDSWRSSPDAQREYYIYRPTDTSGEYNDKQTVEVTVRWIESRQSAAGDGDAPRPSNDAGQLVILRIITPAASAKTSTEDSARPTAPSRGKHTGDSIAKQIKDAIDEYLTKRIVEPGWDKFAEGWTTPVCENIAAAAEHISNLRDQLHQLLLGKPVESLTGLKPLSDIAAEVALPGDPCFSSCKLLVEGIGMGIALLAHQPLAMNACLKAFTHDAAVKVVAKGFDNLLSGPEPDIRLQNRT